MTAPHPTAPPMSQVIPFVFVVDDDVSVRESLEALIRMENWQVETFPSAQEFLSRPRVVAPSCLILDVALPDFNGLELQKRIAADRVDMPIIFITGYGDIPTTVQAMKAGAIEFLAKPIDEDALLGAVRNALERSAAALRDEAELQALRANYALLSRREREVMALVVSGLLNKQVGDGDKIVQLADLSITGARIYGNAPRSLGETIDLEGIVRVNFILPARAPRRLELHCFCS